MIKQKLINWLTVKLLPTEPEAIEDIKKYIILADLNKITEFKKLLRAITSQDLKNYYIASDDKHRWIIKGMIIRNQYFLDQMPQASEKLKELIKDNKYEDIT